MRIAIVRAGLLAVLVFAVSATPAPAARLYRNPLHYAYGTTDPLNDRDRDAAGALRAHRIPTLRSTDLVHWTYVGDAFSRAPAWLEPDSPQWAPDVRYRTRHRRGSGRQAVGLPARPRPAAR